MLEIRKNTVNHLKQNQFSLGLFALNRSKHEAAALALRDYQKVPANKIICCLQWVRAEKSAVSGCPE